MKKMLAALTVAVAMSSAAVAGIFESQCAGCHNGSLAPSKEQLKSKFKNAKAFVNAAKKSTNPMMAAFKNNVEALKKAAKEVYGK